MVVVVDVVVVVVVVVDVVEVGAGVVVVVVVDVVEVGAGVVVVVVVDVVEVGAAVVVVAPENASCANARCSAAVNTRTTGASLAALRTTDRRVAREGKLVFKSLCFCKWSSASSASSLLTS